MSSAIAGLEFLLGSRYLSYGLSSCREYSNDVQCLQTLYLGSQSFFYTTRVLNSLNAI